MLTKRQTERRDLYLRHQHPDDGFDWSDEAFLEADDYESRGVLPRSRKWPEPHNGFLAAKKAMDITIAMWKEDIRDKLLRPEELLNDGYSEKYLRSIGILQDTPTAPAPFEIEIEVLTTHLQTPDVQPDLYTRLYDPATLERSPMLAWVVHAWTRHVAENGSPAARASGAELNRLWDQLSPDEKLVATFLNGKLDR